MKKALTRRVSLVILVTLSVFLCLSTYRCIKSLTMDAGFIQHGGHDLVWESPKTPIQVFYDASVEPNVLQATIDAVLFINNIVGNTVFLLPRHIESDSRPVGVLIKQGDLQSNIGGVTSYAASQGDGKIVGANIVFKNFHHSRAQYFVAVHELLHALGLDHDRSPESIMFPTLDMLYQTVSNQDVELLREVYGR